jgi:nicotinamidase-related amidase
MTPSDMYGDDLARRARSWMEAIAPVNPHRFDLDWELAALLVIDMQRTFLEGSAKVQDAEAVIGRVSDLVEAFKARGRPVVFTRHLHRDDGSDAGNLMWWWGGIIREGSPSSEIHKDLAPQEGDIVVRKNRYDAFTGTDLDRELRDLDVSDLVISGVMTNICCETTAREAFCRDYRVKVMADGTSTASDAMQVASLLNLAYAFAEVNLTSEILASAP